MERKQDRGNERQHKIERMQRTIKANKRKKTGQDIQRRGHKSIKLKGSDDWLPRLELKRMVEPPDSMIYE